MNRPTLPNRTPFRSFMAIYCGSFVGVWIPAFAYLRLRPIERYILDIAATESWKTEPGDYCRSYSAEYWECVCWMLHAAEGKPDVALFEAWSQFDESGRMPTELRLPHPLAGPHHFVFAAEPAADLDGGADQAAAADQLGPVGGPNP